MADLTTDAIKSDIKIFQNFSDAHIQETLTNAELQVKHDQIADEAVDRAETLYARHLLYRDWFMNYGGVQSASTFGNSQTMVNFNGVDDYLIGYNNLIDQYGESDDMGAVWTES